MSTDGLPPAHEVVERALSLAGDRCVVIVSDSSHADVRFANNTTTTSGERRDRSVTVVRFAPQDGGTAVGVASSSGDVDPADLVESALRDAQGSPAATDEAPLLSNQADGDFTDPPTTTSLGDLRALVEQLAPVLGRARGEDRVLAGFAEHQFDTVYLGTSAGLRRRHAQPTGSLQVVARDPGGTRSAWVGAGTPDLASLSVEELEARLIQRLAWAERSVALDAGRYEVVLPPGAVTDLMVYLTESASGREAEEGRTVFSAPDGGTKLGSTLSSLPFELRSDPAEPGLECQPFLVAGSSGPDESVFDNGAALERTGWISGGKLSRLRYHRAGAARSGQPFAAPIDNLVLELPGATGSVEDLVASTERGLLLTCLWYIREADPATLLLTGLTRDGVYLVEHGEVAGAVNNFRFNESPVDLLGRVTEAGASVRSLGREFGEWVNRTKMPPLRVPDFNMSTTSAAS
jgi:predicted Zn-dependent protease